MTPSPQQPEEGKAEGHTPIPWFLSGDYCIKGPKDESQPWQRDNPTVARVRANQEYRSADGNIDKANAAHIVHCVNSHAALEARVRLLAEEVRVLELRNSGLVEALTEIAAAEPAQTFGLADAMEIAETAVMKDRAAALAAQPEGGV